MKFVKVPTLIASAFLAAVVYVTPALATTQSTAPAGIDSYWWGNGWTWADLGTIHLAQGTRTISDVSGSANIWDQGWGGQDADNGLKVMLYNNATQVTSLFALYGYHGSYGTQYFSFGPELALLDGYLGAVDWSANPDVTLTLMATPWAFPGWELHVQNASFSVTSSVPEGGMVAAMLGMAFAGLVAMRRKFASV